MSDPPRLAPSSSLVHTLLNSIKAKTLVLIVDKDHRALVFLSQNGCHVYQYDDSTHSADDSIIDYWNPMDLMPYSLVNFVTFVVSTERKCYICGVIVLNKFTLT